MTWTKLSDSFTDEPAILAVSRSARYLHVEALVWCNRMLTDGLVPRGAIRRMTDAEDIEGDIEQLVAAGLWIETGAGWAVDWTDQPAADDIKAERARRADAQRAYRERKAKHAAGDHSACDPRHCPALATDSVTHNVARHVTPNVNDRVTPNVTRSLPRPDRPVLTRPDPTRPGAKQRAGRARDREAGRSLRHRPPLALRADLGPSPSKP